MLGIVKKVELSATLERISSMIRASTVKQMWVSTPASRNTRANRIAAGMYISFKKIRRSGLHGVPALSMKSSAFGGAPVSSSGPLSLRCLVLVDILC